MANFTKTDHIHSFLRNNPSSELLSGCQGQGSAKLLEDPAAPLTNSTASVFLILVLAFMAWTGLAKFCDLFYRSVTISIQLTSGLHSNCGTNDQSYQRMIKWLAKHCQFVRTRKMYPKVINSKEDESEQEYSEDEEEEFGPRPPPELKWRVVLYPTVGFGVNYATYKGVWLRIERRMMDEGASIDHRAQEILTVTSAGWNGGLLTEILGRVTPRPKKVDDSMLKIYKAVPESGYWAQMGGPKRKRPIASLVLDQSVTKCLVDDVKGFLTMEEWYVERGIPYRRGYLLYGPPGCGKSSIVKAVAGELNYDICVFSLSQKLTDTGLTELFNCTPEKSVILLEDIDAAFKSREELGATARETNLAFEGCSQSSLTFMGLLNALDGVASADDGQILFMTTNYPERLDPALIRPGRVDMKIQIDYPDDTQIGGMFKKFYPDEDEETLKEFVAAIRSLGMKVSMAMLQGLMVVFKDSARDAIDKAKEHFKEQFTNANLAKDLSLYS